MWFTFSHGCHTVYEWAKSEASKEEKSYSWPTKLFSISLISYLCEMMDVHWTYCGSRSMM